MNERIFETMDANDRRTFAIKLTDVGIALHCKTCDEEISKLNVMKEVTTKMKRNVNFTKTARSTRDTSRRRWRQR